jgi:hypothetical protein
MFINTYQRILKAIKPWITIAEHPSLHTPIPVKVQAHESERRLLMRTRQTRILNQRLKR